MGNTSHGARSVVPFRNFDQELKHPGIWEADQSSASAVDNSRDNLASLYRPPFAIMLQGPFEKVNTPHKIIISCTRLVPVWDFKKLDKG